MNISLVRFIPPQRLVELLRGVPILSKDTSEIKVYPYRKARILLRDMHPDELNPGSKYVIQEKFMFQRQLRAQMQQDHGIDTLNLDGGYIIQNDESGEEFTLLPPIVEVTEESMRYHDTRGDIPYPNPTKVKMNVIVDGLHRLLLGWMSDAMCRVVHIAGIPREHPFYALPNEWAEVKIVQEVPPMKEKKNYRRQDSYGLYRDFGVLNCGRPRSDPA